MTVCCAVHGGSAQEEAGLPGFWQGKNGWMLSGKG